MFIADKWQLKLLNIEIRSKHRLKSKIEKEKITLSDWLQSTLSFIDYLCFRHTIIRNVNRYISTVNSRQSNKLRNLGINNKIAPINPNKVIFNFSSRVLSFKEKSILALGLNFRLPIFKIDFKKYLLQFETLCLFLSKFDTYNSNFDHVVSQLKDLAHRFYYKFKPHKNSCPTFSKSDFKILKNLKDDNSIVICRPDKGQGVVVVDRREYLEKMLSIFSDRSAFNKLLT